MLRVLFALPLLALAAAGIATALSSTTDPGAAGQVAVALVLTFAVLLAAALAAIFIARRGGALAGTLAVTLLVAGLALAVVWRSDQFSLESAGADLDQALAEARGTLFAAAESAADDAEQSSTARPAQP